MKYQIENVKQIDHIETDGKGNLCIWVTSRNDNLEIRKIYPKHSGVKQ
jgi:hypothetical protein